MTEQMAPHARLSWDEERGFELDLHAPHEGMLVRMAGVPVPADGTESLAAEAVELDRLEILFKADVDLDGMPGQLQEASVQIAGQKLKVIAKVEDAESGNVSPFECEVPLDVSAAAPASGGPVASSQNEEDLDWEDENTLEQLFGDVMPMSTGEVRKPEPKPGPAGGGFAALLNALAGADPDMHAPTEEVPKARKAEPFTNEPMAEDDFLPPSPSFSVEAEARSFLQLLLEHDDLELAEGHEADELVPGLAPILAAGQSPDQKAAILSDWFLDQEAVEELYIDDERLAGLLAAW